MKREETSNQARANVSKTRKRNRVWTKQESTREWADYRLRPDIWCRHQNLAVRYEEKQCVWNLPQTRGGSLAILHIIRSTCLLANWRETFNSWNLWAIPISLRDVTRSEYYTRTQTFTFMLLVSWISHGMWEVPLHARSYVRSPQHNRIPNSQSLFLELWPKKHWFVCLNIPFNFALT